MQESPESVLIETVAVLAAESTSPSNEPVSLEPVQPEASAAVEVVEEVAAVEEIEEDDRADAVASVTTERGSNDEDVPPPRPAAVVLPLTRHPKARRWR